MKVGDVLVKLTSFSLIRKILLALVSELGLPLNIAELHDGKFM